MGWYSKTFSVRPELPQRFRMPEAQVAEFLNQNRLTNVHITGRGDSIVVFYFNDRELDWPNYPES